MPQCTYIYTYVYMYIYVARIYINIWFNAAFKLVQTFIGGSGMLNSTPLNSTTLG